MEQTQRDQENKTPAGSKSAAEAGHNPENPGTEMPVSTPLTQEQLEELKEKASKAEEYWDRLLRQIADFDNFKKRAARDRLDAIKYANEALLEKLIPVMDNFDMAMAAVTASEKNSADSIRKGVEMIHAQFKSVLNESGLEEINAQNQPFDPNFHEAVSQKETDEVPDGHVAQQVRKGYKYRDRLIRPAAVVVAKKPAA